MQLLRCWRFPLLAGGGARLIEGVTDRKKTCQYAVPADWTQDKVLVGTSASGGVCAAQLGFKDPAAESVAKQIVDTIGAAK